MMVASALIAGLTLVTTQAVALVSGLTFVAELAGRYIRRDALFQEFNIQSNFFFHLCFTPFPAKHY